MTLRKTASDKQQAIKYIIVVMVQRVLGLACFLVAAGTLRNTKGWIYFSCYFLVSVITLAVMFRNHAETLSERGKKHDNTKHWDKLFLAIYVPLAFYIIYIVAGLSVRFQGPELSMPFYYAGLLLFGFSSVLGIWPVLENKHFESTSRIQEERRQTVVTTGPYQFVRHPGYSAVILWAISVPMMLGVYTGIIAVIMIVTIAVRTYFEDTMLKQELAGYQEYANAVKYRLIPFIW